MNGVMEQARTPGTQNGTAVTAADHRDFRTLIIDLAYDPGTLTIAELKRISEHLNEVHGAIEAALSLEFIGGAHFPVKFQELSNEYSGKVP